MTIRADGSDVRRLTAPDSTEWRDAQFSPDGTHIAVRGWKGGIQTIVVMDAGGNDLTPIATLNTPMVDCVGEWRVAWSPDSSALAYALATGCPGDSRIYVASADGARPPAPLLEEDWNASDPVWSPDGRRIAFVAGDGATSGAFIVEVDEDGTLREGSSPRQVGPPGGVSAVRWSPDGSRLAISREEGAGETTVPAILIVDVDGTSPTTRIERAYNPSWSPDGSRMSYASTVDPSEYWNGRPCTVRLGIREPNGELRTLEPLSDGCESWATWSPDGTRLAAVVIASTPEEPEAGFHLAFVPVDSEAAPVLAQDALGGSWQPLAVPLPPAPSFGAAP
jgi:Tol biopolymer transport system component